MASPARTRRPTSPAAPGARRALAPLALLAGALLPPADAAAQATALALRDIPGGRGEVVLGEGGLTGSPPQAIIGSLGAATAFLDLDGDGLEDAVFGAPDQPANPLTGNINDAGHVYVLFGRADAGDPGADPDVDLEALAVGDGLDVRGRVDDFAGTSLAAAGDVDGDGFDDLLIGAPGFDQPGRPGSGSAYVLWGAADWPSQPVDLNLNDLITTGRATRLIGARTFGQAGAAVGGGSDVDGDGRPDLIVGAPLDSTNGHTQNGTATIVYGDASLKAPSAVDLAALGAGQATVVHGAMDLQLLGSSVAGLGPFDPVLPGTGGMVDLVLGDDVALGAPGTLLRGALFTGAVYVLRGQASGPLAASLTTDDFTGGDSAGHAYLGGAAGDQAGLYVASAGDLFGGDGFHELVIGAPFDDGPGRPDCGVITLVAGRFGGTDPAGFDLGTIGAGDGLDAVQLYGAGSLHGVDGLATAPVGDFDGDGFADLAVGFSGANVVVDGNFYAEGGVTLVLGGAALDPGTNHTLDLASDLTGIEQLRLQGESADARGGASLAAGDHNGDGDLDLLIGAPGAPSDPDPLDPTGLAYSRTGRGHTVFGPLSRVVDFAPATSWFEGPSTFVTLFGSTMGLDVRFDGVSGAIVGATGVDPIVVEVAPPPPLNPGLGETVDVDIVLPTGTTSMPDGFTYQPLTVDSGPEPATALPGTQLDFTGSALSSTNDMTVTVGGVSATIVALDIAAGTFSIAAPVGLPSQVPQDVVVSSSNGSVTLPDALTYDAFIVLSVSPTTGPQFAGLEVDPMTPGFTYFGEPDLPIEVTLITSSGMAPGDAVVEFGTDALGYREAEVTDITGDVITCNLPIFLFGAVNRTVDVRVTSVEGQVSLEDAFTYDPSDFTTDLATAKGGFADPPELLAAGNYRPNGQCLVVGRGWPAEAELAVAIMGLDVFDPFMPAYGGVIGPMLDLVFPVPVNGQTEFAIQLDHSPTLGPEGLNVYTQILVQENDGMTLEWSLSGMLIFTVGPE